MLPQGYLPYAEHRFTIQKDDMVSGRVYDFSDNFGTFIAVDDKYSAKLPVLRMPLI